MDKSNRMHFFELQDWMRTSTLDQRLLVHLNTLRNFDYNVFVGVWPHIKFLIWTSVRGNQKICWARVG